MTEPEIARMLAYVRSWGPEDVRKNPEHALLNTMRLCALLEYGSEVEFGHLLSGVPEDIELPAVVVRRVDGDLIIDPLLKLGIWEPGVPRWVFPEYGQTWVPRALAPDETLPDGAVGAGSSLGEPDE
jgi:hypothetical protein